MNSKPDITGAGFEMMRFFCWRLTSKTYSARYSFSEKIVMMLGAYDTEVQYQWLRAQIARIYAQSVWTFNTFNCARSPTFYSSKVI